MKREMEEGRRKESIYILREAQKREKKTTLFSFLFFFFLLFESHNYLLLNAVVVVVHSLATKVTNVKLQRKKKKERQLVEPYLQYQEQTCSRRLLLQPLFLFSLLILFFLISFSSLTKKVAKKIK